MAVVNVLSAQLALRDATPSGQLQDARIAGSTIRTAKGVVLLSNGDNIGSIYRAFSIPAKAMMQGLKIRCPAITTAIADVGLYRTTRNGGAVVTAAFFQAAQALTGALNALDILNGNVITVALMETKLGSHVGPITVGDTEYDVCLTLTAAAGAAGAVFVEGTFTEG